MRECCSGSLRSASGFQVPWREEGGKGPRQARGRDVEMSKKRFVRLIGKTTESPNSRTGGFRDSVRSPQHAVQSEDFDSRGGGSC